ncbi:MAG: hypothetical protein R6X06_04360 [Gammaproteobacteria bacterium]
MNTPASNEHATTDRLAERAHESVDKFSKTAGKAEERIRQEAKDAEAHVQDVGQKAKERSNEILQSIGGFVRDKPLTSLGIAFVTGTVLSALSRHRS